MNDVYFLGMVDDAAFEGNAGLAPEKIESDYDGILIFGVTLNPRDNGLLPTRSQLAEITRSFNREFHYTPVVVVFKYENHIAFANTERQKYKQEWREGEKAGKVSLLRDVDLDNSHSGHLRILSELAISRSGKKAINSFADLYTYWQTVFSVSLLNKKFYDELSKWYFWAVTEVTFPSEPTVIDEQLKKIDLATLRQEHNAKNVIRLLTRFLFVWFVKEKNLIPEELFDIDYLKSELLKDLSPVRHEGLFKEANIESVYYKAILQNLFFASLNCPIEPLEKEDNRERGFRLRDNFGQHRDANYLMRYKNQFKDPEKFLKLINDVVPFLNGGLFECLDNKTDKIYIDGFSDNLVKPHRLIVPDYLFFGFDQEVDLSGVIGIKTKRYEKAHVKGLISILKSYKFTIAENTPIEEDVALDPELLGRVFENLLASYNPETKTTARKQTGSFYTPREIVNYMVDESLIAYLKNSVKDWNIETDELVKQLHDLLSYDNINPFAENDDLQKQIIHSLDNCKILDPACGSGAFPMGILQKIVRVLQKVDPENKYWQELQLNKAVKETEGIFTIADKKERERKLIEINDAFDEKINDPDYARKLFLVENCIYGVDIQEIAAQISKLRFFISLIVDQKVEKDKPNFGIRALPNLETKFVAANTLIGIEKSKDQLSIFNDNQEVKELVKELENVRHRLFSAKSPATKRRLKDKDKEIREKLSNLLEILFNDEVENVLKNNRRVSRLKYYHDMIKQNGPKDKYLQKIEVMEKELDKITENYKSKNHKTAMQLASWDPYDQNVSSAFFDPEWMFGIRDGFDIVIGNPPYVKEYTDKSVFNGLRNLECYQGKMDLWYLFGAKSIDLLKKNGLTSFIATNNWITNEGASKFRNKVLQNTAIKQFLDFRDFMIFESASIQTMVYLLEKNKKEKYQVDFRRISTEKSTRESAEELLSKTGIHECYNLEFNPSSLLDKRISFVKGEDEQILEYIFSKKNFTLDKIKEVATGIDVHQDFLNKKGAEKLNNRIPVGTGIFNITDEEKNNLKLNDDELHLIKPFYTTEKLSRYYGNPENDLWVIYTGSKFKNKKTMNAYPNIKRHLDRFIGIISSDNKPYGLHRARKESFFQGNKIISLRKCPQRPVFTYTDFDCYVSQTFFVIKSSRISQKYLTAFLNSSITAFWLRHKGKMQGTAYQIDKGPIQEIPIYNPEKPLQLLFSNIVDSILFSKENEFEGESKTFETITDALVFQLYFSDYMKEKEIDILKFVEQDLKETLGEDDFEQLPDEQKENVIKELNKRWSNPDSEIVKRMNSFAEKSPDILKPILESK
ncbi:MAG: N-6 DNA methylase [Thermodesulfobacteriota bacterium]|nr:N-6 DNA methylase [Thermodesulfobacteriota bacterium]